MMVHQIEKKYRNAKVFIRIAPSKRMCWEHVKVLSDKRTIYVRRLQDFERGYEDRAPLFWKFRSDGVFYNSPQQDVYDEIVTQDLLKSVFNGYNAIILAFGATGTGKTLTINGLLNSYQDRGITPRLIMDIYEYKNSVKEKQKVCIKMSYIETKKIYITDLLRPERNLYDINSMKHITSVKLRDEIHALKLLFSAEARREYVCDANYYSNAGNGVLTFHIITKSALHTDPIIKISKIHIIDLGGVDTVGNLSCFYKSIFDIGNANLAKSQLEQFILILSDNIPDQVLVKQRLNILILYLKDSLNTTSLLRFIGHIGTKRNDLMLTLSMLRFTQIVREMRSHFPRPLTIINEEINYKKLQDKIVEMEKEKHLHAIFNNKDLSINITTDRILHLKGVVEEYIKNNLNEFELMHFGDFNCIMKIFKDLYNELEVEKNMCAKHAYDRAYEDFMNIPRKDMSVSTKNGRKSGKMKRESITSVNSGGRRSPSKVHSLKLLKKDTDSDNLSKSSLLKFKDPKRSSSKSLKQKKPGSFAKLSVKNKKSLEIIGMQSSQNDYSDVDLLEDLPPYDVAFKVFIEDSNYKYDSLNEIALESELKCKNAQKDYLHEVKVLQDLIDMHEKKKQELLNIQMQKDAYIVDLESIKNLENDCLALIQEYENQIMEQQEKVLYSQTDLKIYLQHYQDTKKDIDAEFDKFCADKYKTVIPDLEAARDIRVEYFDEMVERIETMDSVEQLEEVDSNVKLYNQLKQILTKQLKKNIELQQKKKKKTSTCKT